MCFNARYNSSFLVSGIACLPFSFKHLRFRCSDLPSFALSTVTYVGCKDYDDDIDNLQTQIDANKASIAELQNFVKEGKWVTNVEQITDGFKITFNDNKSYSITSGKDATPTTIKIDPVTKNWIVNDNDLGICAEGKKGADGKPGAAGSPGGKGEDGYAPQISENGFRSEEHTSELQSPR